jgi:hypothetical protein
MGRNLKQSHYKEFLILYKISVYLFRRVFRNGAIMESINFRDGIVGNVKKTRGNHRGKD